MSPQTVSFARANLTLAAQLYIPEHSASGGLDAAIVIAAPGSSVKEQVAATYASRLAALGFIVLTYDPAYQGQSSGMPRDLESPAERLADLRSAVDFLVLLAQVDHARIGMLGICAGGGYAANAAMTDHRVRALGAVVPSNIGRAFRAAAPDAAAIQDKLDAAARYATTQDGAPRQPWIPDTLDDAHAAGITDVDVLQAVTYYRTTRGHNPRSTNRRHVLSDALILGFDAFHLADVLLTQPVQVIVAGDSANTTGSFEDGHQLTALAVAAAPIHVVAGARHYEMYDTPGYVDEAVQRLGTFFSAHLPA